MLTLATMIMWRIWKSRNAALFNGDVPDPRQAVVMAAKDTAEYVQVMGIDGDSKQQNGSRSWEMVTSWKRPMRGILKVNVDGAWENNSNGEPRAGAGMVVRDSEGNFVAARSINLGHVG